MTRSEIEARARQTLQDHNLLQIPVDPLGVAKVLGIRVLSAVFSEEEKSGAIVNREGTFSIFVNANEPPARQRFTVAHEIDHRLLHMDGGPNEFVDNEDNFRSVGLAEQDDWDAARRKEWEANVFASALLMDASVVREKWQNCKDPAMLAWTFQVSTTAMVVRLTQLGLLQQLG